MQSVLVIGLGKLGYHLAMKMQELGNDVMVVDSNAELVEQYADSFTDSHIGDCTNREVLSSLDVPSFDICFVTIGSNFEASVIITLLLKKLGASFIVAKAGKEVQRELLYSIGANEVIYPEYELAEKLAVRYDSENIFDYIPLTDTHAVYEITVPRAWLGKSLKEVNARQKYAVNIIAVKHGGDIDPVPDADRLFSDEDHLMIIGRSEDVFKLVSMR
ncbi:MAG: TrkA family potassium uptake protein [Oscillospiraceae bacterium]|nr:TrkA family potassium uptake protein [Oscillospiraceae bacterium]